MPSSQKSALRTEQSRLSLRRTNQLKRLLPLITMTNIANREFKQICAWCQQGFQSRGDLRPKEFVKIDPTTKKAIYRGIPIICPRCTSMKVAGRYNNSKHSATQEEINRVIESWDRKDDDE